MVLSSSVKPELSDLSAEISGGCYNFCNVKKLCAHWMMRWAEKNFKFYHSAKSQNNVETTK